MPSLGDYLGHLLAEITKARMEADRMSVLIAQHYQSDELLKTMAVPRFRLPKVELDVPVAISTVPKSGPSTSTAADFDLSTASARIATQFIEYCKRHAVELSQPEQDALKAKLKEAVAKLEADPDAALDAAAISSAFQDGAGAAPAPTERGSKPLDPKLVEQFFAENKKQVHDAILGALKLKERTQVLATTAELHASGSPELLVHIRLSLVEEGMQWTETDTAEGKTRAHLVPE